MPRQSVLIEVIDAIGDGDYNQLTVRLLVGLMIFLAAGAALPQAAPRKDYFHGAPNTTREIEIRPGVDMGVVYGSDGSACRMDIAPLPRSTDPKRQDVIPDETLDGILNEVAPPDKRGRLRVTGSSSPGPRLWMYDKVVIEKYVTWDVADPQIVHVTLASVEFDRDECARFNTYHSIKPAAAQTAK